MKSQEGKQSKKTVGGQAHLQRHLSGIRLLKIKIQRKTERQRCNGNEIHSLPLLPLGSWGGNAEGWCTLTELCNEHHPVGLALMALRSLPEPAVAQQTRWRPPPAVAQVADLNELTPQANNHRSQQLRPRVHLCQWPRLWLKEFQWYHNGNVQCLTYGPAQSKLKNV